MCNVYGHVAYTDTPVAHMDTGFYSLEGTIDILT